MDKNERKLIKKVASVVRVAINDPKAIALRVLEAEERARKAEHRARLQERELSNMKKAWKRDRDVLGILALRAQGINTTETFNAECNKALILGEDDFTALDGTGVEIEYTDTDAADQGIPFPVKIRVLEKSEIEKSPLLRALAESFIRCRNKDGA